MRASQLWACKQLPFLLCMPPGEHNLYSYSAAEAHALLQSVLAMPEYTSHGTAKERGLRLVIVPVPADAEVQLLHAPPPEKLDLELADTDFPGAPPGIMWSVAQLSTCMRQYGLHESPTICYSFQEGMPV